MADGKVLLGLAAIGAAVWFLARPRRVGAAPPMKQPTLAPAPAPTFAPSPVAIPATPFPLRQPREPKFEVGQYLYTTWWAEAAHVPSVEGPVVSRTFNSDSWIWIYRIDQSAVNASPAAVAEDNLTPDIRQHTRS